jgi:hypothetical protein
MDSSLTIKPRDSVSRVGSVRPSAARTEVAPSQSVTPAAAVETARQPAPAQDMVGRDLVDPQNRDAIFRMRDERVRRRLRKSSDEALLRQRAYGRSAAHDDQAQADPDAHADFEV